jgi:hypothetical protein
VPCSREADPPQADRPLTGLAHVATVSYLASRASPSGGFWIALAGGVASARAGERHGARRGYGASIAAMLETVAIMGPARLGIPLTQAISAPLLGRLEALGVGAIAQTSVCAVIRLLHNAVGVAFFIWIILGGLDAYAGTYDAFTERLGLGTLGETGALVFTAGSLLLWAIFASSVQVAIYRRGLRRWPDEPGEAAGESLPAEEVGGSPRRFDPRAVTGAGVIAFGLLIASTDWALLGAVTAWLMLAWATARPDRDAVPTGLALTAVLALSAFGFALFGGLGLDVALRRGARAGLLVLVATWLRAAAGSEGLREVSRRALLKLRAIPSLREAAELLPRLGSERRLVAAGRSLLAALSSARKRPMPILDAVLGWVASQSGAPGGARPAAARPLQAGAADAVLVALAAAPCLAFVAS